MDGELAREAFAPGSFGFGAQARIIAKVGKDAIDRLHAGGGRSAEAQRPRQLVGEAEFAVGIVFGRGAERGGQILRPQLIAASDDFGSR